MTRRWVIPMAAALLAGCAAQLGPVLSAGEFQARYPANVSILQPGDQVRLSLYGDDALTDEYEVGTDGTVSIPLVGAVPAQGRTVEELRAGVEATLANGYYQNPRVAAQLVTVQPIYVLGEVNRAGSFPFAPDLTVAKAAALAGGYTYFARVDVVGIRRARADAEVLVVPDGSIELAPGDTVRILERGL